MPRTEALTSEQRSLRARIGGFARAGMYDGVEVTAAARERFLARFLEQVDRDHPGLAEHERQRRAHALRRAHFTALAYRSAVARRRRQPHTKNARSLQPDRAFAEAADATADPNG